jgi:hypothetical protein
MCIRDSLQPSPVAVELQLRPRLGDPGGAATVVRVIDAGHVLASDDLVDSLFRLDNVVGSLRIVPLSGSAKLLVSSRTYNIESGGSYGQRVPAVPAGARSATLIHHHGRGTTRTNLGLCEVAGGNLTVRCRLFDRFGHLLGEPIFVELAPYRLAQLNGVFDHVGVPSESVSWVELDAAAGDGAFVGYASVVDNVTGDAVYVPAHPTTAAAGGPPPITR